MDRPQYHQSEKFEPLIVPADGHQVQLKGPVKFDQLHNLLDSLAAAHFPDDLLTLAPALLAWENPWLLDSIRQYDYYRARLNGSFIENLNEEILFHSAFSLKIPDNTRATVLKQIIRENRIDVNIPAFRLVVINRSDTLCSCPVRVGRNETMFLEAVGHEVDLRTPIGIGTVFKVRRYPRSVNLHTGEPYVKTLRDDGRITQMPGIPSLEPKLDGKRWGKMIHATTNQATLGKAWSHGCVGLTEACMWTLYFLAPEGTALAFRYDLGARGSSPDATGLPDIYDLLKTEPQLIP